MNSTTLTLFHPSLVRLSSLQDPGFSRAAFDEFDNCSPDAGTAVRPAGSGCSGLLQGLMNSLRCWPLEKYFEIFASYVFKGTWTRHLRKPWHWLALALMVRPWILQANANKLCKILPCKLIFLAGGTNDFCGLTAVRPTAVRPTALAFSSTSPSY